MSVPQLLNRCWYRAGIKRGVDVVGALLILLLTAPILVAAWLAVRLTSAGGGFFAQKRVGHRGEAFTIYKLRTMYQTPPAHVVAAIEQAKRRGILFKADNDPRVTPVGRFLRRSSIDELPQLLNVLLGDMSLVGPRPLLPFMLEPYPELCAHRSRVRPGITGLWQISKRGDNTSAREMERYDIDYVERHSALLDAEILLRTPLVVLRGSGAV